MSTATLPTGSFLDAGSVRLDVTKNKMQSDFLACTARYQLVSGGFGSGKTTICCAKAMLLSALMPGNLGAVVRQTYPDLRDTTRKAWFEIMPPSWVRSWKESENALTLKNNSVVIFRYFENGIPKVGANLGWFFIDQAEEATEDVFTSLMGRLRRPVARNYGLLAMNPNGEDWQHRMFFKNKDPRFAGFQGSTYDNEANLPAGYIQDMLDHFPEDWVERYVDGKWTRMSGLIFHEFDEERHSVDPFEIPRDWARARGNDWGVDAPATAVFVARSPEGVYHIFDEYGDRAKTAEEHAAAILAKSRPHNPFRASWLDASAWHREADLKSVGDRYATAGYYCQKATTDLSASILLVKQLLKTGRLLFMRGRCPELIKEMKAWKWAPRTPGREVPARGNDHYLDALRYVLYGMDRRGLAAEQREAAAAPRQIGRLRVPRLDEEIDQVTGLPA